MQGEELETYEYNKEDIVNYDYDKLLNEEENKLNEDNKLLKRQCETLEEENLELKNTVETFRRRYFKIYEELTNLQSKYDLEKQDLQNKYDLERQKIIEKNNFLQQQNRKIIRQNSQLVREVAELKKELNKLKNKEKEEPQKVKVNNFVKNKIYLPPIKDKRGPYDYQDLFKNDFRAPYSRNIKYNNNLQNDLKGIFD